MALWSAMFLAEKYGRLTLTLDEVAAQIGLSPGTIRNRRMRGEFAWMRADGRALCADVSDVVAYLEQRRTEHAVAQPSQQCTASESRPTDAPLSPSGRRRRTRVPEGA